MQFLVAVVFIVIVVSVVQVNGEETFSCEGRASGYYADVDTGCQVYHMCDGLGRQFSYSCPNTTLFQQRMLICDHWYMVNCSRSVLDYEANLLIGQRDKPFVEDSSERPYRRTPRPDLLVAPYAPLHQDSDAYRRGKSHGVTSHNLVGVVTDEEDYNGDGDTDEPQYVLPSHWSLEYARNAESAGRRIDQKSSGNSFNHERISADKLNSKAQLHKGGKVGSTASKPVVDKKVTSGSGTLKYPATSSRTVTKSTQSISNEQQSLLPTLVVGILPGFNQHSTREQERFSTVLDLPVTTTTLPLTNKPITNTPSGFLPTLPILETDKPTTVTPGAFQTFPTTNSKQPVTSTTITTNEAISNSPNEYSTTESNQQQPSIDISPPSIYYQPPKLIPSIDSESTTMDPQTFYRLVPSKDLQPPKLTHRADKNERIILTTTTTSRSVTKKETATSLAIPSTEDSVSSEKRWMELRKMFFIPEYDFPLEVAARPGYEGGVSSFQVSASPSERDANSRDSSRTAVNSECPKCDPAFVVPGTCKPCVMIR